MGWELHGGSSGLCPWQLISAGGSCSPELYVVEGLGIEELFAAAPTPYPIFKDELGLFCIFSYELGHT